MKCERCGAEMTMESNYCYSCGLSLKSRKETKKKLSVPGIVLIILGAVPMSIVGGESGTRGFWAGLALLIPGCVSIIRKLVKKPK
jgi:hypothetical protein